MTRKGEISVYFGVPFQTYLRSSTIFTVHDILNLFKFFRASLLTNHSRRFVHTGNSRRYFDIINNFYKIIIQFRFDVILYCVVTITLKFILFYETFLMRLMFCINYTRRILVTVYNKD